jgi:hypothetical protein
MGVDQGRSVSEKLAGNIHQLVWKSVWKSMVFSESSWNKSAKTAPTSIHWYCV